MYPFKMYLISIKNKFVLLLAILGLFSLAKAQPILSNKAEISVLTCSEGDDLYNTFGHTGIRINDPVNQIDVIFNYGMFSFGGSSMKDQIDFGITFIRGKLNYWLGTEYYEDFLDSYIYQERWVKEQVLNLDSVEKQKMFNALIENAKPENRQYKYDFFFDNCSSRVRDMIVQNAGDVFGGVDAAIHQPTKKSFIDLINPYIKNSPWLDFGMDIMLGLPSSRKASEYEYMFLPEHLMEQISKAPGLVKSERMLIDFPQRHEKKSSFHLFSPLVVFSLLFLLVAFLTYRNYKNGKHAYWIDGMLLFFTGLFGLLFLFMWLFTDHIPAHANLNMFWAFPLNLIGLFLLRGNKYTMYFKVAAGFCAFILLAWFLSPQQYNLAVIPISLMLLVRYLKIIDWKGKNANNRNHN